MRIDKMLAHSGLGSRKDIKKILKTQQVKVNGERVRDPKFSIDPELDVVKVNGEKLTYQSMLYYMMNKPKHVISATEDQLHQTVIDLIQPEDYRKDLFPVGRLDRDTTGLLLITNDGPLAHRLLSPKKHVEKKYWARIEGFVEQEDVSAFASGVTLEDGYNTMPAKLNIIKSASFSEIEITIKEGKFHQIKRMFQARNKVVIELKRLKMGPLVLDPLLNEGSYRKLTAEERILLNIDQV